MVRGQRNQLPPALLMLGFGLMFRVSDESKSKHVKHRLYDTEEPAGPSARAATTESPQRDATPERNTQETADSDSDSDDDDEDQGDLQQRANPLQSNNNSRAQEDTTTDALAELSLSKDQEPNAEEPAEAEESSSESELEEDATSRADTTTPSSSAADKKPLKRGQRSKAKKMATKYKDQDDEDRELMESLLGVTAARQKAEAAAAAKAQRDADAAAAQERRRQAQERAKKQVAEHEKLRQMMLEDDAEGPLDDDESGGDSSLQALDGLVGTPLPGDEMVEVVPVCAPWSAMGRIKYKAKLQPGGTKKGKAVREVVDRWRLAAGKKGVVDEEGRDPEKMWPREVELIKGLKVEEAFNCVPVSKVTVMMAGGGSGGGGGGGGSSRGQKKGRGGKGSKR